MSWFKSFPKLYSVFTGKCPSCLEESMYVSKNPYSVQLLAMHKSCSCCGLKYEREPSFFYGAMYISYALTIGMGILFYALFWWCLEFSLLQCFFGLGISYLLLMPLLLRWSRNIWINCFISYRKSSL